MDTKKQTGQVNLLLVMTLGSLIVATTVGLMNRARSMDRSVEKMRKRIEILQAAMEVGQLVQSAYEIGKQYPGCAGIPVSMGTFSAHQVLTATGAVTVDRSFCFSTTTADRCVGGGRFCLQSNSITASLQPPSANELFYAFGNPGGPVPAPGIFPQAVADEFQRPVISALGAPVAVSVPVCNAGSASNTCIVCGTNADCVSIRLCTDGTDACNPADPTTFVQPRFAFTIN